MSPHGWARKEKVLIMQFADNLKLLSWEKMNLILDGPRLPQKLTSFCAKNSRKITTNTLSWSLSS